MNEEKPWPGLPNTENIHQLLDAGQHAKAHGYYESYKEQWFERAKQGEPMNLSDLLAGAEALHIHEHCVPLYDKIGRASMDAVPIMTTDRRIPRKEQAALARKLFKLLGFKGISVTAPRYAMAHSVDVYIPDQGQHDLTTWPHDHSKCCGAGNLGASQHDQATRCPACRAREAATRKIEAILAKAFPNHNDRSRTEEDYFDFCWSIDS
jgi:hypothetical protein